MSDRNPIKRDEEKAQKPDSVNFGKWTAAIFVGHAVGGAIFVGLAGLVFTLPARQLVVPYTMLLYCSLVLSPLLYWARCAREQPKSCAIRFGIAFFVYLQVLMLALGFSAIRLGILSRAAALNQYAPLMLPFSALTSFVLYVLTRQILRARKSA